MQDNLHLVKYQFLLPEILVIDGIIFLYFRHSLLSTGIILTERMWYIASICIKHAFDVTLYCLRQLMTPFEANSDNFYGDVGLVKVAVRKDSSGFECERLRQLAQQVLPRE